MKINLLFTSVFILHLAFVPLCSHAQNNITTIAGGGTVTPGNGGSATAAGLGSVTAIAFDAAGNKYIADKDYSVIRKVDNNGIITTVAGVSGTQSFGGDNGPATSAYLNQPYDLAFDAAGNLYIADLNNHRIRKVDLAGNITTVAGNGIGGFSGDNSAATSAKLNYPMGVAVDQAGNIYIADQNNSRIRKVDQSGIITSVVGTTQGYGGDNGPANAAQLSLPSRVSFDMFGNMYISDYLNSVIRKVDQGGMITTVAGNGTAGYSGNGGQATAAELKYPCGVAFDASNNMFICDFANHVIRYVDQSGRIQTVAGTTAGFSGDNGPALSAQLQAPLNIAFDAGHNLYIADQGNYRVRQICYNLPAVTASSGSVICSGTPVTITAGGASTYTWDTNTGSATTSSVSVTPSVTTSYSVTGADVYGCKNIASSTFTVNALPNVSVNSGTICAGQSFSMTPGGANTYTFSSGNSIVTPTVSATYTITGTDVNLCSSTALSTVTVNSLPLVSLSTTTLVCDNGGSISLNGIPAGGTYSGPAVTGSSFDPMIAGPGTYTVYYSYTDNNSCSNMDSTNITVQLCMGLQNLTSLRNISVYPNPFSTSTTIEVGDVPNPTFILFDLVGKQVREVKFTASKFTLERGDLTPGIYFYKLQVENALLSKGKIVIE